MATTIKTLHDPQIYTLAGFAENGSVLAVGENAYDCAANALGGEFFSTFAELTDAWEDEHHETEWPVDVVMDLVQKTYEKAGSLAPEPSRRLCAIRDIDPNEVKLVPMSEKEQQVRKKEINNILAQTEGMDIVSQKGAKQAPETPVLTESEFRAKVKAKEKARAKRKAQKKARKKK